MARRYRLYQVDAFTRQRFSGNAAGVVPDARGLTDREMISIARELNNSETAFIFPADDGDVQVRFFTPTTEVPVCGHATIAAHYVRAHEGAASGLTRQHTAAGIFPIEIERGQDGDFRIWMRQQPAEFGQPIEDGARDRLLTALGLTPAALGAGPIQIVSTGHSKLLVPLADRALLDGIVADFAALAAFSAEIGCNGYYPFTTADPDPGADAHGRMFAPAIGIAEDPVTGNASGSLGAYLLHYGLAEPNADGRLTIRLVQGERVGRPGSVQVEAWRGPSGSIEVRIAGEAVIVFETEVVL